jgi:UDP-glucose-4-epimerase GalE
MKAILVTGGAGYIGSHTLRALAAAGFSPVCFDNLSTGFRGFAGSFPFVQGDLANTVDLDSVFESYPIQAVVHFASHALVEESCRNPHKYYHDNILNCLNLLEAMRSHEVNFIVFSSTCATYGIPGSVPISESAPRNPVNPYGVTKMVIERILEDYGRAHGLRFVALRYFNAAGADPDGTIGEWHDPETHLIPRLFEAALGRVEGAQIYGDDYPTKDGTCIRDYIHVTDLGTAHVAAIDYLLSGNSSDSFNLGTGQGRSVLEVLEQAMRATGTRFAVRKMPRRTGDPPALVADPRKANSILRWSACHSGIDEIVASAWNWHRKQAERIRDY